MEDCVRRHKRMVKDINRKTQKSLKYYQNIFLPLVLLSTNCDESLTIIDYVAEQKLSVFFVVPFRRRSGGCSQKVDGESVFKV